MDTDKTVQLVVARYREKVEWVKPLGLDYIIYNKGPYLRGPYLQESTIALPNEGRESGTFLYHIVNNYDKLADYTVFLQGTPFHHSKYVPNNKHKFSTLEFLCDTVFTSNWEGCPHHCGLNISGFCKAIMPQLPEQTSYTFSPGAQYIVPKEKIISKSYEWWDNTKKVHDEWPGHKLTSGPWLIERLWGTIWEFSDKT